MAFSPQRARRNAEKGNSRVLAIYLVFGCFVLQLVIESHSLARN